MSSLFLRALAVYFICVPYLQSKEYDKEFRVIKATISLERPVKPSPSQMPWDSYKLKEGEALVSLNCGFLDGVYYGYTLKSYQKIKKKSEMMPMKGMMNGACDMSPYLFNGLVLVAVREWEGVFYILDSAPLHTSDKKRIFLSDQDFISDNNFTGLLSTLNDFNDQSCIDTYDWSETNKQYIAEDQGAIIQKDTDEKNPEYDLLCYNKVVYVDDLIKGQNK